MSRRSPEPEGAAVTAPVDPVRLLLGVLAVQRVEHERGLHPGAVPELVAVVVLPDHDLTLQQLLHPRVRGIEPQREIALQVREVADHRRGQPGRVVPQVVVPVGPDPLAVDGDAGVLGGLQKPAHHPRLIGRRDRVRRPGQQPGLHPVRLRLGQIGRAGRLAHRDGRERGRRVPAELHGESVGRNPELDVGSAASFAIAFAPVQIQRDLELVVTLGDVRARPGVDLVAVGITQPGPHARRCPVFLLTGLVHAPLLGLEAAGRDHQVALGGVLDVCSDPARRACRSGSRRRRRRSSASRGRPPCAGRRSVIV